jgi:alpha-amylase
MPFLSQHKLGADRTEIFQAVPVQSDNRLKNSGPTREIEVERQITF